MNRYFLLILTIVFITTLKAEEVTIYGNNTSYASKSLQIVVNTNPFMAHKKVLKTFDVANDGSFKVIINIDKTELITIPLYTYTGFLYVQPNGKYEIKLPPLKKLSPAQKLNPFFEPEELMLGVVSKDKKELNRLIRIFDDNLDRFINNNFNSIYRRKQQSKGIEFSEQLTQKYANINNAFFQQYVKYRLGFLEFLAYPNNFELLQKKYFRNGFTATNNPACVSLYKKLYSNFLDGYLKHKNQLALTKAMATALPFKAIAKIMEQYPTYKNKVFRDRIIATATYDSFVQKFISKTKALAIFKALKKQSTNSYNKMLCSDFINKITHLQHNTKAPNFNIEGKTLADYKGKYLYLNFCNTQNYACQQDFKLMQQLQKQFGKYVHFVSIVYDWDIKKYQQFMAKHSYNWDFLVADRNSTNNLLQQYNIKAFPSYTLITPYGDILKTNAPSPKDNIRVEFVKIAREMMQKK